MFKWGKIQFQSYKSQFQNGKLNYKQTIQIQFPMQSFKFQIQNKLFISGFLWHISQPIEETHQQQSQSYAFHSYLYYFYYYHYYCCYYHYYYYYYFYYCLFHEEIPLLHGTLMIMSSFFCQAFQSLLI